MMLLTICFRLFTLRHAMMLRHCDIEDDEDTLRHYAIITP